MKKSTEIIVKTFLRVLRILRGEMMIKVRPQGAKFRSAEFPDGSELPGRHGLPKVPLIWQQNHNHSGRGPVRSALHLSVAREHPGVNGPFEAGCGM